MTVEADAAFVTTVRRRLHELAEPARAPQMRAYMKSSMPFLGVRVPQVRAVVRAEAREQPPGSPTQLVATVLALWRSAEFREERYAATALLGAPSTRSLRRPEHVTVLEELIVAGAWWDHVDELSHRVGDLLREFPDAVRPAVVRWQTEPDRWLRRSSIICQLGCRDRTDLDLLVAAVDANAADPDFFLRKAIGWALREYARTDPDWVRAFVASRSLSALSRREALKHLG
ncbi:3-methyladenine DNA glycosylase AlkD [Jatrophihabitans endophyticus]|uniref:3-methyladenine DNA glycosylase AlkD n=1 Tax=Jatrophihabitans endophyticus TaxID=1206085 RepID=A0A1M5MMI1_9ACTN|nr:DNA alkylation repair protein [Jatrophihabitans endophyticus]SHG78252.1 3-methyladenine DNA glycosylase AlkD [Jatrophihabitans endophyticus]